MRLKRWLRITAGGVAWAAVYNAIWGAAWFTFMRGEWLEATVARGRELPWTSDFWVVWVPMTVTFGVAIAAYVASRPRATAAREVPKAALVASLVLWVPGTVGMAIWAWQEALSWRVIVMDSVVNLFAVVAASLFLGWSLVDRQHRSPSPAGKPSKLEHDGTSDSGLSWRT